VLRAALRVSLSPSRPYARNIGARPEVVVLADAVRTKLQLVNPALDDGVMFAAEVAVDFAATLIAGAEGCRGDIRPMTRFDVDPDRDQNHAC